MKLMLLRNSCTEINKLSTCNQLQVTINKKMLLTILCTLFEDIPTSSEKLKCTSEDKKFYSTGTKPSFVIIPTL